MFKKSYKNHSFLPFVTTVALCSFILNSCSSTSLNHKQSSTSQQPHQSKSENNALSIPQVSHLRKSNGAVIIRKSYDYAPSVMKEGGKYRMWWCGGVAGDFILYSEADTLRGNWSLPTAVFRPPLYKEETFDMTHTCDPSVIRVGSIYYMYYGGNNHDFDIANPNAAQTRIGIAQSEDGINWERMNDGNPILRPSMKKNTGNRYGAGQPSAIYLNGYFYIMYTDTTGADSNPKNGAGQYVIRSKSPAFENYDVLTAQGFVPRTDKNQTEYSVLEAFSVDMMYSDAIHKIIVATHNKQKWTTLHTLNEDTFKATHANVDIAGSEWHDGPGLVRQADGHAIPSNIQRTVSIDIFSANEGSKEPATWDLFWQGADLKY